MKTLLLFPFLWLLFATDAHATQVAIVTSPKAIVYSDQALNSPIGYVKNGRKLLVGTVVRGRGTIVPVVVAGKVAYIQIKDVALSDKYAATLNEGSNKPRVLEHKVEEDIEKFAFNFKENNYMLLALSVSEAGGSLTEINEAQGLENTQLNSFQIMFEHRPEIFNYSFGLGLSYNTMTQETYSIRSITVDAQFAYSFLRSRFLSLEGTAGFSLSGDYRLETEDEQIRGALYGHHFGAQARFAPRGKFGFVLGIRHKSLIPFDSKKIIGENNEVYELGKISGVGFYGAVSYRF